MQPWTGLAKLAGWDESQHGMSDKARLAVISSPPVFWRWVCFPSAPKAFLSPSEWGFRRTVCGHVIDTVEETRVEAAYVIQGRNTGPQLRLLGSFAGVVLTLGAVSVMGMPLLLYVP